MATVHPTLDRPQNNLRGLMLMLAGFFLFSIADLIAKLLTAEFHPIQIVWVRQLGLTVAVLILIALRGPSLLRSVAPKLQVARGLCAIVSAVLFIYALRYVPLADAVAVTFVAPFMVTILSALILREPVGIRRWSAVLVGFVGTLIVIRPGAGVFHPAIFLVLGAASAFAARQILSRYLGNRDRTETTLAYTAGTSILLLFLPMMLVWKTPTDFTTVGLMALLAILAAGGEFLIIKALEIALAVVVSPAHYSLILFGTFWGWMAFGHLPDMWTLIGAAIIVASGLYMMIREARLSAGR